MGLLDWLTEGTGSSMGGGGGNAPFIAATNGYSGPGGAPDPQELTPPVRQAGAAAPPLPPPLPPGSDPMTAGGPPPNGPGLPPSPPVPMPMAQPPGALPPNAAPTGGAMPPMSPQDASGIAQSYQQAGGNLAPPEASPGATTFIGRALGLDANRENQIRGSLGSGLKAAGENAHKPGLAAFAGSAGAGIEGGKGADDKTADQQSKYLKEAIAAQQVGDTGKLNIARTRLALAQAKAAEQGKDTKNSVMNTQEQLYLRGLGQVNADGKVKASLAQLRAVQTQFGADSKEAKAALASHNDLIDGTKKQVFGTLGVNEKDAAKIGQQPGFSFEKPFKDFPKDQTSAQKKFDELPVGAYFINPKNGGINPKDGTPWLLIKQPPKPPAAGATTATQAQSPTPAAPVPVTAPAGSPADQDNED